ncbi:TonB-dependent receptor [Flammeovirga sp. EKP202]|uniref:SusC/RagA family TonB-linked outer membrane protein n=1 Tax=Flammeovirga sp. EKP202 TaxID=2770592 RepID=UPI00165F5658|nr:TonB-dependent receptor [Flammeovirga sp. EKP202]MBD0400297.1 TonB-dependent receptor [Flammeovirga sp. EKP202]
MKGILYSRQKLQVVLSIILTFTSLTLFAQERVVKGNVTSEDQPLIGANVLIKGTSIGTLTDFDGNFTLTVPDDNTTLIFSYIGFLTEEVYVGTKSTINIGLKEDAEQLEEIVVVGYGTMKKSDLTGAVNKVQMDDIPQRPAANVEQLLQGQAAGLQITNSSGQPGSDVSVRLRGLNSFSVESSPLLVVDGFPIGNAGNLKQINPNDIKSIEVLKDASAAAIYGSRGANGVIMITTKKGTGGKMKVDVNSRVSVATPPSNYNVITNPAQFALIENEGRVNAGLQPFYVGETFQGTYYPSVGEIASGAWGSSTDWADLVYRNALAQDHNVSASGGSENTKYYFSLGYLAQDGINIGDDYRRYNMRVSLDQKIYRNLTAGVNVIYNYTNRNANSTAGIGRSPVFPAYNEDGSYFFIGAQDFYHPMVWANEVLNNSHGQDFITNMYLNLKIMEGLELKTTMNVKSGNSITDQYEPIGKTWNGAEFVGYGSLSNYNDLDLLSETYFNYSKSINDKHRISAMAGWSAQRFTSKTSALTGRGFVNDNLANQDLNSAESSAVSNGYSSSLLLSGIGRLNYVYDDRFLITATMRADGSSKFGANNKWGYFPSVAVGWNVQNEAFLKNSEVVSQLKLRASWGQAGNQGLPAYRVNERYGTGRYPTAAGDGTFSTGFGPGQYSYSSDGVYKTWQGMANQDLKWETTTTANVGVDLGLFQSKVMLTAEVYHKLTSDLLRTEFIAPSAGYDLIWVNNGEIKNTGVELTLDLAVIEKKDWDWSVKGMISHNKNEVVDTGGTSDFEWLGGTVEQFRTPITTIQKGQPIGAFYGYKTDGIIQTFEEGLEAGLTGSRARPGEIKYVDINGDGVVDTKDRTVIGDPNPTFIYSFSTKLRYKNVDFSVLFTGVQGNQVFNNTKFSGAAYLQRWTPDNPSNEYPSMNSSRAYEASDYWIEDGSYLRIQNINIGYNFNSENIKWMDRLRVYTSIDNPIVFSDFQYGYDPEVGADGIHWGNYPMPTTYSLGLNVSFK